jgi:arginine/lysine/ornithine decarboxylase
MADDDATTGRLLDALRALVQAAPAMPSPRPVDLPAPADLELESVVLPRDAFFGRTEDIPAQDAAGRVAAEQITPYPPGIPVIVPGEKINAAVIDYLQTGLKAGMVLPDPADPSLHTIRVLR